MKAVAIIQARMGSTRLPGKVMKMLATKTVLGHVLDRVRACRLLDDVVVATTIATIDDLIVEEAVKNNATVYRGSENDVLSRYYFAARQTAADVVVRVTSDCPLFDGNVLTSMMDRFSSWNSPGITVDYLSNSIHRTFPRGLDAEVMTFPTLDRVHREATRSYEREHVTPYVYEHPDMFRIREFRNDCDLSAHRWTLDTEEDWSLIDSIYRELGPNGEKFSTSDVLRLLARQPGLTELNAHVDQKKLN